MHFFVFYFKFLISVPKILPPCHFLDLRIKSIWTTGHTSVQHHVASEGCWLWHFIRIQFGEKLAFTELNTKHNKDKFVAYLLKFTQHLSFLCHISKQPILISVNYVTPTLLHKTLLIYLAMLHKIIKNHCIKASHYWNLLAEYTTLWKTSSAEIWSGLSIFKFNW